uniref:Ovule protein n=1 Tax=Heterorhabditis bacteriophora TaxID=37862 RepID=A0A1I7WK51_HETBA
MGIGTLNSSSHCDALLRKNMKILFKYCQTSSRNKKCSMDTLRLTSAWDPSLLSDSISINIK